MSTLNDTKKKRFQLPSSTVMLFIIICAVAIMTWIVPAGQYDMVTNEETGTTMVDAASYHQIEPTPIGPFKMFTCIAQGFLNGAQISFLIVIGYFWISCIMSTGALNALINKLLASKARDSRMFIPIIMVIIAFCGSTYGEFEIVYGLLPVFVAFAIAMGYDAIVGMSISALAVAVGFACATTNAFTIGIAQGIGELPIFSGLAYRWIIFVAFVTVTILWVMRYAKRVKANPEKSIVYGLDYSNFQLDTSNINAQSFTSLHKLLMVGMLVTVVIVVLGCLKLGWYMDEMSATFLIAGILSSVIAKRTPEQIADTLLQAFKDMAVALIVIGLSRTILVIMQSSNIIHSIIYYANSPMSGLPKWATAVVMLFVQNIINFFIPSGTGQAAAIMPIMIPLADLAGLNRQIAVLAYQFGDGFSNMLWPTAQGAVMCGIARIPLGKWYRYFLPLFGILFLMQCFFMVVAVLIDYGPF